MKVSEILEKASQSRLLREDPYVKKIWELVHDRSLFEKSPDYLLSLRRSLLREALDYFRRHSDYYARLFEKLDINPRNAELEDLEKLAVPSELIRGEGHKRFLIRDVEPGGKYFMSSGTTGRNTVKVYRSPLDLAIMITVNTALFEYVYGGELEENKGIALFMAAPELKERLNFVAFVHYALEAKGIELLYGMRLLTGVKEGTPWQRLVPNKDNLVKFLKSKEEPKLFFTAPAGVYLLSKKFGELGFIKRIFTRILTGAPPVDLGRGGVIVTGGGTKGFTDLPPYDKIVELARRHFYARNEKGEKIDVPFMDVLGMTETLAALISRFGIMDLMPHPLTHVFLLEPKTFKMMHEDGEGILGMFNPFTTSWLEVFYPGDILRSHPSDRYYGKEYVYVRRLTKEEGWDLQRACGGTLEELMTEGRKVE
ncbi:MAG: hypothetical protein B6U94_07240 [Thermofilum sp. ex4484_79]|nr:MAG: hypothetical protein B6U94_07240 [Thermofilum sp. ex4484_79]